MIVIDDIMGHRVFMGLLYLLYFDGSMVQKNITYTRAGIPSKQELIEGSILLYFYTSMVQKLSLTLRLRKKKNMKVGD
jgi:hypothetical protein